MQFTIMTRELHGIMQYMHGLPNGLKMIQDGGIQCIVMSKKVICIWKT